MAERVSGAPAEGEAMTKARQRERKNRQRQAKLQRDHSDVVRILDAAFHALAKDKASQTGLSIEEVVDGSWNLFEHGFLRLASDGVEPVVALSGASKRRRTGLWLNAAAHFADPMLGCRARCQRPSCKRSINHADGMSEQVWTTNRPPPQRGMLAPSRRAESSRRLFHMQHSARRRLGQLDRFIRKHPRQDTGAVFTPGDQP
jgi:hypothetical protein